jgi:hypothetical protein
MVNTPGDPQQMKLPEAWKAAKMQLTQSGKTVQACRGHGKKSIRLYGGSKYSTGVFQSK